VSPVSSQTIEPEDNYPNELRFCGKRDLGFQKLKVNSDIKLAFTFSFGSNDSTLVIRTNGRYNLNAWANQPTTWEWWEPEVKVLVCMFFFDKKGGKWVGGILDEVNLSTAMFPRITTVYDPVSGWPKFKSRFSDSHALKVCVVNVRKKQRSTFSYTKAAVDRVLSEQ
jgi:hypothetical protein